jgi:hypothetical protein
VIRGRLLSMISSAAHPRWPPKPIFCQENTFFSRYDEPNPTIIYGGFYYM